MFLTSKSFSLERDFEEVAKTSDEKYLLDFASFERVSFKSFQDFEF